MDVRIAVLLVLAVIASGCADTPQLPNSNSKKDSGKGLVVQEFSVADRSLSPGQKTAVSVTMRNYHTEDIDIKDVSLYNLGFLELRNPEKGWKDRCTPDRIETARKGFAPMMECNWIIEAPESSELGDFRSKSITMKLNLEYSSKISNNQNPLQVDFRPVSEIDSRKKLVETFSNGEVKMKLSMQNPAPSSGAMLDISVSDANEGNSRRVISGYRFSYTPESVFPEKNCPRKRKPVTGTSTTFGCEIVPSGSPGTRNLFISTSYKYVKSPSLDVEVIKP